MIAGEKMVPFVYEQAEKQPALSFLFLLSGNSYSVSKISSKINKTSIGVSTALDISIASFSDGLYLPASRRMIVSRLTPTFSASCS